MDVLLGDREHFSIDEWRKQTFPITSTAVYDDDMYDVSILQVVEDGVEIGGTLHKLRQFIREKKFGPIKLASLIPSVVTNSN